MKVAIIVAGVLVLTFVALLFTSGKGIVRIQGFDPPPNPANEDTLSDWQPPSIADLMARVGDRIAPAPRADLGETMLTVEPGSTVTRIAARSDDKVQVAKVSIRGDGALLVSYECTKTDAQRDRICPQVRCLCANGSKVNPLALAACDADFRNRRVSNGQCTADKRAEGSIFIYPEARTVRFSAIGAIGTPRVTAELH